MKKVFSAQIAAATLGIGLTSIFVLAGCSTSPAVQAEANGSTATSVASDRVQWIAPGSDHAPSIDVTYKNAHPPKYPKLAIVQHHQGVVVLDVTIDAKAHVKKVAVEHSSGYQELDDSAALAARDWIYGPGVRNGKVVGGTVRVPIYFHF